MPSQTDVVVDGRRLEVRVVEPTPGQERAAPLEPSIVLLHEGLGSVALWKSFPDRLSDRTGRRVYAYSRFGYGRSDVLEERRELGYMHREGEIVLPELLSRLGIARPILFGHSDGASIALIYAGAHPHAVSALVLEAPHVFVEECTVTSIQAAAVAFRETELPKRLARYHTDAERTFWGWNDIWLDPRFRAWNIEPYLAAVRCPVLLIQGEDDEYGTAAQLQAISTQIPATEIVTFDHCAHSPHRDQEQATLEATASFLRNVGIAGSVRA